MRVSYHNRSASPREAELGARLVGLEELLRTADVLALCAPATEGTRHVLDAASLALMKPGAIVVNTARGPLIDEAALAAALRHGRLRAAGLDVYEREPEIARGLTDLDNVVLLPRPGLGHRGSPGGHGRAGLRQRRRRAG